MSEKEFQETKVLIIGCGQMGSALVKGLVTSRSGFVAGNIFVFNRDLKKANELATLYKVSAVSSIEEGVKNAEVIILAVKPISVTEVLSMISVLGDLVGKTVISVAAGVPLKLIAREFSEKPIFVRAMPNLPVTIGEGVTAYFAEDDNCISAVEGIFSAVGKVLRVSREEDIDIATGLSASGPAFIVEAIAALAEKGEVLGLSQNQARYFAKFMAYGITKLLIESKEEAGELVKRIASPNGTTEAGLRVLGKGGYRELLAEALEASVQRAKEISQGR